jgi:RNA polymerase sigma-70 factor (ECF subfamily)
MQEISATAVGDQAAKLRPLLYRLALLQLRDGALADDVVQETLLAAVEGRCRFEGRASLKTWLISILRYKVIDAIRARARLGQIRAGRAPLGDLDDTGFEELFTADGEWATAKDVWADPHVAAENQAFLRVLEACMRKLPPRTARAFLMREWLELDPPEICTALLLTPGNLRVLLWRARMQLRLCLDVNWDGST